MAGRVKVIDLAKELGVTSKDLLVALEGMGHKGKRAMTPLDTATANELRVKLGRGRDLPAEVKPKRPAKVRAEAGEDGVPLPIGDKTGAPGEEAARSAAKRVARVAEAGGREHPRPRSREAVGDHRAPRRGRGAHRACPVAGGPDRPGPLRRGCGSVSGASATSDRPADLASGRAVPAGRRIALGAAAGAVATGGSSRRRAGPAGRAPVTAARRRGTGGGPAVQSAHAPAPDAFDRTAGSGSCVDPPRPAPLRPAAAAAVIKPEPKPAPPAPAEPVEVKRELIKLPESVTVGELAAAMRRKSGEVIKALLELGVMATLNEVLDPTAAKLVADKFSFDVEVRSIEGDVLEEEESDPSQLGRGRRSSR